MLCINLPSYIVTSNLVTPSLHPRYKLRYFKKAGWEDEWIDVAENIVKAEYKRNM